MILDALDSSSSARDLHVPLVRRGSFPLFFIFLFVGLGVSLPHRSQNWYSSRRESLTTARENKRERERNISFKEKRLTCVVFKGGKVHIFIEGFLETVYFTQLPFFGRSIYASL